MALRSYDAHHLVNLPPMNAREVAALGNTLLTVGLEAKKEGVLPDLLKGGVAKLQVAVGALLAGIGERLPVLVDSPPLTVGVADRDEDGAWGGLYRFLLPFSDLPDRFPQKAQATGLLTTIFPTGLRFTQLSTRAEWTEAESRRARMVKDGLDAQIEVLGGGVFVAWLKSAHAAYGVALGITEEQLSDPKAPLLGDQRRDVLAALRSYVMKVVAHADADDPALQALSERLLRPLVEWQQRRKAHRSAASAAGSAPVETEDEVPEGDPAA